MIEQLFFKAIALGSGLLLGAIVGLITALASGLLELQLIC